MTPGEFVAAFDVIAEAPGGIERLRELVLQLAVRGRLVPQDEGAEAPVSILERNAKEKRCLVDQRKISKPKSLPRLSSDEVPFNVPETWQWIRLGDVALVVMGNSPPGSSYNEQGLGVPLINGPVEFSAGAFGLIICRKYTTKPNQMCTTGDMLICVRGATTGRTNIAAFDACIGRGVALVRAWDAQQYVNLYLWYVGKELLAAGKGTTFPSISYADLAGKPLPLPPLAEQHRIVAKVDELMGLIDRLAAARRSREDCRTAARDSALAALRNASTSEDVETAWTRIAERMDYLFAVSADLVPLREAVLQLAVRGRLVSQNADDEPASELLEQITIEKAQLVKAKVTGRQASRKPIRLADPPFLIPKSWEWIPATYPSYSVSDLGKKIRTKEVLETGKFPVVDQGKVKIRGYCNNDKKVIKVESPLILFGDHTREIKLIDFDFVVGADGVKILKPICILEQFYFLVLKWLPLTDRGYGRHFKLLKAELIPLPPLAEQHRIVAKVDELMGLIDRLEQHLVAKEETQRDFAAAFLGV